MSDFYSMGSNPMMSGMGMGMGMMNPMMSGMGMMGGMSSGGTQNNFVYFKQKYGCPDCFIKSPVPVECQKHINPLPDDALKQTFWTIIKRNILGG